MRRTCLLLTLTVLASCKSENADVSPPSDGVAELTAEDSPSTFDQLSRRDFNRLAAEHSLPLFWIADQNDDKSIDATEIAELWGVPGPDGKTFKADGNLTDDFAVAYAELVAVSKTPPDFSSLDPTEAKRRTVVLEELSQGRPTLVATDFSKATDADKKIVRLILEAAAVIESIHAKQTGAAGFAEKIPADDAASRMLFYRNQGPWCVAPGTENNAACSALAEKPKKVSGLYPADIQSDDKFCETLAKRKDADKLMHQFVVVQKKGEDLIAVPYTEAYSGEMKQIAEKLEAAAALTGDDETAFKTYLLAAAKAFGDNQWESVDEAWSKMNVHNSKWYLRIGPDEVYFEPCGRKAGFHVSFARINQDSLTWQNKLDPVKGDMEKALAAMAGRPYKARKVSFHMPDFIDIIVNAGDSRSAHGATIGQSLPNWGPVANEGRGRTVAMTNLYTDEDSKVELEAQAKSLLCKKTMTTYTRDPGVQVMSTVLHEAAHNLGPAHEYKVKGKTASQIFGGPLASTLEELKAQTSALYFTDWLAEKNIIDAKTAQQAHVRDVIWGFGHISRGMYTANDRPKPYSQLAAIQFGHLMASGAIVWKADEKAANGTDVGCLELELDKFPAAIVTLEKRVAGIKARGDKKDAAKIKAEFVDVDGAKKQALETIRERWLRAPKATFVYAITE